MHRLPQTHILASAIFSSFYLWISPVAALSHSHIVIAQSQSQSTQTNLLDWKPFIDNAGGFKILLPSKPVEFAVPITKEIKDGRMFMQMRLVTSETLTVYAIAAVDFAVDVSSPEVSNKILLSCKQSFGKDLKISNQKSISLDGYHGTEVVGKSDEGGLQISRCYIVGQKFYMLIALTKPFHLDLFPVPRNTSKLSIERTKDMDVFFDSLQLLKKPKK